MNNPYIRFFVILTVPLILGFGIGYSVHPSEAATVSPSDREFSESFPTTQNVADASRPQESIDGTRQNAITRAVARVSPAVVGINVIEVRRYRDPLSNDPFFQYFFGDRSYKQEVKGLGSGFIISPDGYIVTNDHVAGNATDITVTLTGGKRYKAEIVGTDATTDICLLKLNANDLPYVELGNSDEIIIGEWAIALGNPFGLFEINDKPTVTVGVVSSTGMKFGQMENRYYRDMIETDAAINGGNSGGPLVNNRGQVMGMNTLIYTGGQSATYIGYGFAIPVNKVKKIVADLKKKGKVTRDVSWGFEAQPVDARIARYFGMKEVTGIIVSEIKNDGPADKAGLKVGDVILEVNGDRVNSDQDFIGVLVDSSPGEMLKLKVFREKKQMEISLTLGREK
jgi:serine protease Do